MKKTTHPSRFVFVARARCVKTRILASFIIVYSGIPIKWENDDSTNMYVSHASASRNSMTNYF